MDDQVTVSEEESKVEAPQEPDTRPVDAALDALGDTFRPAATTLAGDLRDRVLDFIRNQPAPWHKMSEAQQREFAYLTDGFCRDTVRKAVDLIAAEGRPVIVANLKQVTIKDETIEGKLVIDRQDERRHDFYDAQDRRVMVVVSDASAYLGERAPIHIDAQEPELPLGEGVDASVDSPGYAAAMAGEGAEDNPHPLGSVERQQWAADWILGWAQRERPGEMLIANEARQAGYADGFSGEPKHADIYQSGEGCHVDYALGVAQGEADRAPIGDPLGLDEAERALAEYEEQHRAPKRRGRKANGTAEGEPA